MSESFVVKNTSGAAINIEEFGIYNLPNNASIDLVDFGFAMVSAELATKLGSGDLTRLMDGVPCAIAECHNHALIKRADSEGVTSHSFATWQDKLVLNIPNATTEDVIVEAYVEFTNDTKDKKTEVRLLVGATEVGICQCSLTDKNVNYYEFLHTKKPVPISASTDIKIQSQVAGGTISIRRARIFVWRL